VKDETEDLDQVLSLLAFSLPLQTPSPAVRERLLARVRQAEGVVAKRWSPAPGVWVNQNPAEGLWKQMGTPGVSVRVLHIDRALKRVTTLVRMEAGTSYPRHRHHGPEESYVIDGDVHIAGAVLRKGDYQRADAESIHEEQFTEGGCTMLVISSPQDEILV
jgi:putative transcriptional regulator